MVVRGQPKNHISISSFKNRFHSFFNSAVKMGKKGGRLFLMNRKKHLNFQIREYALRRIEGLGLPMINKGHKAFPAYTLHRFAEVAREFLGGKAM